MVTKKTDSKTEKKPAASRKAPATPATSVAAPVVDGLHRRREVVGVVVSDKMQKTIVVKVDRQVRHPLYKKYVTRSRRFKAHDENNTAKMGDQVLLIESRPLSRDKRWALKTVVRKGGKAPEANV